MNNDNPNLDNTDIVEDDVDNIKQDIYDAVDKGDTFHTDIKAMQQYFDIYKKNWGQVQKAANDLNAQFAGAYNIEVEMYHKDSNDKEHHIGNITELPNEISFTFDLPTGMKEQQSGDTKKYVLVRVHKNVDGTTSYDQIDYVDNGNGTFTAKSNKYSDFIWLAVADNITVGNDGVIFDKHNIVLSDEIAVNFRMIIPEAARTPDAYMEFVLNGKGGKATKTLLSEATVLPDGRYQFTCRVNAIQMADTIVATYHYGENKIVREEYSVNKYVESILASSAIDEKTKNLAKCLADYGYYAQRSLAKTKGWQFGIDYTEMPHYNSVNTGVDLTTYAYQQRGEVPGISKISKTLLLDSRTSIKLLLTMDSSYGKTPEIAVKDSSGNVVDAELGVQSDGRYSIIISGISAHKIGNPYTITVDGTMEIQMSALSYAQAVLTSSAMNIETKEAVAAMNAYYNAAIEYRR